MVIKYCSQGVIKSSLYGSVVKSVENRFIGRIRLTTYDWPIIKSVLQQIVLNSFQWSAKFLAMTIFAKVFWSAPLLMSTWHIVLSKVEIFFLDIDWGLPKVQNHLTNQKMQNISNWQCFRTVYTQVSLTRTVQNPYFPSLSFCFSLNDHVSFNTAIIISTPDCVSTVTCTRIDWEFTSPSLTPSEFNLNLFLFIEYTVRALKHYSNLSVSMSI